MLRCSSQLYHATPTSQQVVCAVERGCTQFSFVQ
jgi:hypothetical protein